MRVEVATTIFTPPELVWEVLTDWERQPEWMPDALEVRVVSEQREGEGVRLECPTRAVGVTILDELVVTAWRPPEYLEVEHLGRVITGTAAFELETTDLGTRVRWWEDVEPPLGVAGRAVARTVVAPWLRALFRRSLRLLRARCEQEAAHRRRVRGGG